MTATALNMMTEHPQTENVQKRRSAMSKNNSGRTFPAVVGSADNRQTTKCVSKYSNITKKAHNKLFQIENHLKKKSKTRRRESSSRGGSRLVPKFAGCGPGGING